MRTSNWFDEIEKRWGESIFPDRWPVRRGHDSIAPFDDFMAGLEGLGFQDKGDHYELTTDLGGQSHISDPSGDSAIPSDAVKVELTGEDYRIVEVSYEHSTGDDGGSFYSHSQKTSVSLPADADEKTIKAFIDDDDNVVVSVDKKAKEPERKGARSIPVGVRKNGGK